VREKQVTSVGRTGRAEEHRRRCMHTPEHRESTEHEAGYCVRRTGEPACAERFDPLSLRFKAANFEPRLLATEPRGGDLEPRGERTEPRCDDSKPRRDAREDLFVRRRFCSCGQNLVRRRPGSIASQRGSVFTQPGSESSQRGSVRSPRGSKSSPRGSAACKRGLVLSRASSELARQDSACSAQIRYRSRPRSYCSKLTPGSSGAAFGSERASPSPALPGIFRHTSCDWQLVHIAHHPGALRKRGNPVQPAPPPGLPWIPPLVRAVGSSSFFSSFSDRPVVSFATSRIGRPSL
jgi:hypothetical protein